MYDPILVQPMRDELTVLGVEEALTPDQVDSHIQGYEGTVLVVVNSVCGCAAANARPAVQIASDHDVQPDKKITVFAGMEKEATQTARGYFTGFPPSSPSMGLLKNGELVFILERHQIEGRMADQIARDLINAYDEHCK